MIIGIDASRANREQKTGVEWYAFHLLEEMKRILNFKFKILNSDEVRVVLYSDKPLTGELANLPENWESKALRWPLQRLWTQARLSWEMLTNSPDVLFIPAHVPPLIHPKKTVMMVHDIAAVKFPESYSWFERWYSVWSAKYALNKLWRVIVPSEFTKREIMKLGNEEMAGKIFAIHHGYDPRYRKIEDQTAISHMLTHYNIKKPFILSVGRWETKKNTARIIEAFDQLTYNLKPITYNLVLIGKPGHGYEKVKEAYEQSPYKDRILMHGYVDPEDLVYIMNAAEVFVFPSLYEGFGLPVLEALACGTPVVAGKACLPARAGGPRQGSCLEEVGGEACVYVDPLDVDDIACGIREVLENQEKRKEKREMGLERVKEFSWEKCARETLEVLLNTKQKPD